MVITSKLINLDAEIDAALHVMRIAVIASAFLLKFSLLERDEKHLRGLSG